MSLRKVPKRLARSQFARNVAVVATGTAGAQAITMAIAPLITRLYGPEAFGIMGTFLALVGITAPLAALSYPIAIVLPKDDSDALGIALLSVLVSLGIAAAMSLVILVAHEPILTFLNLQALSSFLFLIPIAMLFSVGAAVMGQWVIRKKLFKIKAKMAVANSLVVNSAKAGLGFIHPVAAVLVVLSLLGTLLHALMLLASVRRVDRQFPLQRLQPKPLKELALRHRDFPLYRTPQIFLNSASMALPVLILTSVFGPASAGFYTLGKAVLALPSGLIGRSVADVFYPRINEAVLANENSSRLIIKATMSLAILGFLPFAIVFISGPQLFGFVFGADWTAAGEYARWLALWLYAAFMNRPSVAAIPVLGFQKAFLGFEMISVVVRIGSLIVGFVFFESDVAAVALFSLGGVVLNVLLIGFTLHWARANERK